MNKVLMYTTAICPYCVAAKNFLVSRGLGYDEVRVDRDPDQRDAMIARSGRRSVPQIFVNGHWVGGYEELAAADRDGRLARYLAAES